MFFDWTWLILIPGLIISMIAQAKVSSAFNAYSKVSARSGMTGQQVAERLLALNQLRVSIHGISGELTDHYDSRNKSMALSAGVGQSDSIAAIAVAAHETGHACQDGQGYFPLRFRNVIVPLCNFTSNAAWPLFFIGLILGGRYGSSWGLMLMNIGILFFAVALVFYIITLPVEFNASHRALVMLKQYQLIDVSEERAVKKVLRAAAMTYVASTLMAFLNLFRMLLIRGRN